AKHGRGQPGPAAQAEEGGRKAGGQQAGVIDEGTRPQEPELPRATVTLRDRDGLYPVRLDLQELVGGRRRGARSDAIHVSFPPLALPRSGLWRSARRPPPPPLEPPPPPGRECPCPLAPHGALPLRPGTPPPHLPTPPP